MAIGPAVKTELIMNYDIENKWANLALMDYCIQIHYTHRDKDANGFCGTFQKNGLPETKKSTPRCFSVMEVLEFIENKILAEKFQ